MLYLVCNIFYIHFITISGQLQEKKSDLNIRKSSGDFSLSHLLIDSLYTTNNNIYNCACNQIFSSILLQFWCHDNRGFVMNPPPPLPSLLYLCRYKESCMITCRNPSLLWYIHCITISRRLQKLLTTKIEFYLYLHKTIPPRLIN